MDPWLSCWEPDSLHYAVLGSNEIELCILSLHTLRLQPIENVSEDYSLKTWLKRSFHFWKVNEFCFPPDLYVWFRRTSQSRLLSMLDEFCFCFHFPISWRLPQGAPVLIYRDNMSNKCLKRSMNDEFSVSVTYMLLPTIFLRPFWQWIGPCIPSLSSKSKFQRDLNHIWHRGNLIGNGKLLFCLWENDVNIHVQQWRRARPWWDYEMWNLSNPHNISEW